MYQQEDGSLLVYFTNPQSSDANLMCEIQNENGETIYKSGVIRPGEYIERLEPLAELSDEAIKIELYVYAFEPDTWYSKGTINLSNKMCIRDRYSQGGHDQDGWPRSIGGNRGSAGSSSASMGSLSVRDSVTVVASGGSYGINGSGGSGGAYSYHVYGLSLIHI